MGRSGGFLDFNRKEPGYRKVAARLKDYNAVELQMSKHELRAQAARCMDCGTPFCHASGCPLANIIPEFNDLVYQDRWKEALDLMLATNNFPEFTGRLCPAICEPACVLSINDDPVTIRQIEVMIAEKGYEKGYMRPRLPKKRLNRNVAVIGSGPAGLTVADELNHAGYNVVVYEQHKKAGGVLRYGIPDFKLEKWIIDRRIELMEKEGIVFEYGISVGEDISYKYIQDRFNAICLAGGSRIPRNLEVSGRELDGIHFAMDFLVQQNMRVGGEDLNANNEILADGLNVLVLGGGDTGADCLGTSLRQGAKKVYQYEIMPQPPDQVPENTPWPSWPNIMRKSSSHAEGGDRRWCMNTKEFKGKNGRVSSAIISEIEWVKSDDGRMEIKEKPGTELDLKVDLVLLALGFVGPGKNTFVEGIGADLDERGNVKVDQNSMTSVEGVFASGDMAQGQSLIVKAIADGRKTADGIISFLG